MFCTSQTPNLCKLQVFIELLVGDVTEVGGGGYLAIIPIWELDHVKLNAYGHWNPAIFKQGLLLRLGLGLGLGLGIVLGFVIGFGLGCD